MVLFFGFIVYLFILAVLIFLDPICLLHFCLFEINPSGHRPGKTPLIFTKKWCTTSHEFERESKNFEIRAYMKFW